MKAASIECFTAHATLALAVLFSCSSSQTRAGTIVAGTDSGTIAQVKVFSSLTLTQSASFLPYSSFAGGVRVAVGDVNGDGTADIITGVGPGAPPHVKVFNGQTLAEIHSFFAFSPSVTGGVSVATGDINNDGRTDLVVALSSNAPPQVSVFNATNLSLMFNFFAYAPSYTGGVRVAVGDVNGDSVPDIITGAASSVSHVKVFSGANGAEIRSFLAFGSATLGVFVAAGDINGDGFADIIVGADAPGPPHVKAFSGRDSSELRSFFAYGAGFTGGVRVAAGDINGDGRADIITGAGSAGSTHVKVFSGADNSDLASFLSFSGFSGGVFVGSPVPVGPGATVRGLTFLDSNADGKLTAGEPAFPSVTLFIDGNQNGAPDNGELTISSGGNGSFGVTNLAPGSYAFQQLPPPGYFSTVPNPQFVSLAPGQVKTGVDFGLHGAPRLSINLLSGKAVLSWPSFASSFQLEYATNVVGDVWLPSQERPALSGGFYVVTQSVSGARSFFRLRE